MKYLEFKYLGVNSCSVYDVDMRMVKETDMNILNCLMFLVCYPIRGRRGFVSFRRRKIHPVSLLMRLILSDGVFYPTK